MSKKRLHSRIESFFTGLAGEGVSASQPPEAGSDNRFAMPHPGISFEQLPQYVSWFWETDADLNYTFCGPDVSQALHITPQDFLGKSFLTYALLSKAKEKLAAAFKEKDFPTEITVMFSGSDSKSVPARIHILSPVESEDGITGWRGYTQCLPDLVEQPVITAPDGKSQVDRFKKKTGPLGGTIKPKEIITPPSAPLSPRGYAVENGKPQTPTQIWTNTGVRSLANDEIALNNTSAEEPAAIAVPMHMQDVGDLLLEIVDDGNKRTWSDDDRFLVMEVADQLALALDNAQLYISVQQELAERVRAEQANLRRNKDLATLNQIGQRLSRLATRAEIYELLSSMIGEVLDNRDLYICAFSRDPDTVEFPVYRKNGLPAAMSARPFGSGIPEYICRSRAPLLVTSQASAILEDLGIILNDPIPASLIAIPMIAGERLVGAIVVQDFQKEQAYDALHVELLSTAAAQATTSLENAALFQQMEAALEAIENRERYQSNVASAAAALTEFGTKSMPEVLKLLGQAAKCSRVYYARLQEDERGIYWASAAEWIDPALAYLFDKTRILHIPVVAYPTWEQQLREKGSAITQSDQEQTPEAQFLNEQHIRASLLLAVPGKSSIPDFIAFDQYSNEQQWHSEEINALRVAADAISNTFVREGLMDQIQLSLEETEGLYNASNHLTQANDMQEMVQAILSGMRILEINRAVLLLFEYDPFGKLAQIAVGANWYSGRGTPPPPVGTEYPRIRYERFFQMSAPLFLDDILDAPVDKEIREILLQQKIRALAMLPLWSSKRQNGILLLQAETKHHFSGRETRTFPPLVDQMAIAVENQRLFDQTQRALAETGLLYNVSNQIAQASETQEMLALVIETLLPASADYASLILVESDPNGELIDLEFIGFRDVKGDYQPIDIHVPPASLPLIKSLADEPLLIQNIYQESLDPASQKTLIQMHITACCLIPLRTSGRLIGILVASSPHPAEFVPDDIRLLRIAGNGIAVALEKQRLLRQAQRRALELQTASEIARDTASTLSLDLLLARIVQMLSERFGYYHSAIFLLDENNANAVIREATGEAGQEMKQKEYQVAVGSQSVVGVVTETGKSFIINDVSQNQMFPHTHLLSETRSEMGVPLKLGPKVIGALDLQSREINAFSPDDVTVLQILADQIAIAIENAQAYELSQKAIADMKELDRVKSQFLANMSHELRTPLNSIIGFSRVIIKGIDGPVNELQKQDLNAIYNSGQHLLRLINDILDLSKIEAGKMELTYSDINLADLITSAMSTAVGLVKDKPIQLRTIIPESLPLIQADNTRVRQVLINFLSNAAKFTDEGTITVEAMQSLDPNGKREIMVTVTDSGPGIAPADQGKLFLPFSQVDDSPTRKTGGTGLGLSICRSLIDMHEGRIGLLRSELGRGCTFFFTLPADLPEMRPPVSADLSNSNVILAIDDDPRVINLYERYLKPHGYTVFPLTDPTQALKRAREIKPVAITLDIMMPQKDGWHVLQELKNNPETRNIPIIICSILEHQEKGFSLGAADYLVKPFLEEDILNSLGRLNHDGNIRDVLFIDDDLDDLRLVQKMFEKDQRYRVTAVHGGMQGWDAIQSSRPDAVLLDLFMPDMNGFMILENLRADPALRHIPVIILTGADLSPEQHRELTDFSQGILAKGYLREKELLFLVEDAIRKFRPNNLLEQ